MRFRYSSRKMAKLFANTGDPDQTPHFAASDLGLHCLPITLLEVSKTTMGYDVVHIFWSFVIIEPVPFREFRKLV